MDAILGYQPQSHFAIRRMDTAVLDSARSAIVRCYQQVGLLETILDVAALGGIRALAEPFDLCHITRALVRSLVAERFNAFWETSGINGPFAVKISWRAALHHASQARRSARKLQTNEPRRESTLHETKAMSPTDGTGFKAKSPSPSHYAPSIVWSDAPIMELEALANPAKLQKVIESYNT